MPSKLVTPRDRGLQVSEAEIETLIASTMRNNSDSGDYFAQLDTDPTRGIGERNRTLIGRLIANGMDPKILRTNDTLPWEVWQELNAEIVRVSVKEMVLVGDMISHGMTRPLRSKLGTPIVAWQSESDMSAASIDMKLETRSRLDRTVYSSLNLLPVPVIHKDFSIDARDLAASRDGSNPEPLDLRQPITAVRKVNEGCEQLVLNGTGGLTVNTANGNATLYGLANHPYTLTGSMTAHWDASAATATTIFNDVTAMIQQSRTALHRGPWILYFPLAYKAKLDQNFSQYYQATIRDRIKQIEGIEDVKCAEWLTANTVLLLEMDKRNAQLVLGMAPTVVEWPGMFGFGVDFKALAVMSIQIMPDYNNKLGVVLYS